MLISHNDNCCQKWINSPELIYRTCGNSTHYIADVSYLWSFMHYLSAWNNDCNRFHNLREQTPFSAQIKMFYLFIHFFNKPSAQPSFRGHFLWSRGCPLNRVFNVIDEMNRRLPSSRGPLFQNEVKCSAFDMKMIVHCDANKTNFHKKGCVLDVNLKVRVFGTRKWPISMVSAVFCSLGLPVI